MRIRFRQTRVQLGFYKYIVVYRTCCNCGTQSDLLTVNTCKSELAGPHTTRDRSLPALPSVQMN